jgi:hypothetical protein
MKEKYFRIIELETHQILLTKDFDSDEKASYLVCITFFVDGLKCSFNFGFSAEKKRDDCFRQYSKAHAQTLLDATIAEFATP